MVFALLSLLGITLFVVNARPSPFFGQHGTTLESVVEARMKATSRSSLTSRSVGRIEFDGNIIPHPSGVTSATLLYSNMVEACASAVLPDEAANDAILIHCSGHRDFADFGDYFLVPAAESKTSRSDSGKVDLRLLSHMGCPIEASYVCGGAFFIGKSLTPTSVILAAVSRPMTLGADTDAVGTRISYGSGAGDMQITWTSMNASAIARVRVGTSSGGPYDSVFYATSPPTSYSADDMCHAPANTSGITSYLFVGYFHTVLLTLSPATRYWAVYGQEGGTEAPETSFTTRASPGPDVPVRMVAFGDSATYPVFPGTVTTTDMILALDASSEGPVDCVALVGDLAYAEGSTLVWTLWTGMLWPISSTTPFQVTVGNHEVNVAPSGCSGVGTNNITALSEWPGPNPIDNPYGDDSGGEGGYPTFTRYRSPGNGGLGVFYYSFDIGSVHMTMFSSEHDYRPGSAQFAWLSEDLMGVNRSLTPWLIVGMHRPMYNSMVDGDYTIDVAMAATLEGLFTEAAVDLSISGHYHSLLRTFSMRNFTVDPTGASPVYITVGTGGATYHNESIRPDGAAWTAAVDAEWGFGFIEAFNRSHLRWTFRANADGGAVHDETWILRENRWGDVTESQSTRA